MNPFLALIDLSASPPSRQWLGEVDNKLRALPHDRYQLLDRADAWIAQATLETGAISSNRPTPRQSNDERYIVVFSGWIENRDEIDRWLIDVKPGITLIDDADRALAGWQAWGDALADKLYGEYAIVIYDASENKVTAIRDKIGIQPLFYWVGNECIILSNLPGLIALAPFVGSSINDGYLAEFLHANLCSPDETLFKHVTRLPGGHALRVSAACGPQITRYWHPPTAIIRRPMNETLREFERIFFESVRSAATNSRPLTVEISGGIDSSSVAVAVSELTERGALAAGQISGASITFPGLPCDETVYSDAVAVAVAFKCVQLSSELPELDALRRWTAQTNYPVYPFALFTAMDHYEQMRTRGSTVVLTGEGGDELCRPSERTRHYVHFSPFHVRTSINVASQRWRGRPRTASFLGQIRHTIRPWLGDKLDAWISRWRRQDGAQAWCRVNREWAQSVGLEQRLAWGNEPINARTATTAGALTGFYGHLHENIAGFACLFGVEPRHPFYSARLVEFANCLPIECLDDFAGITKWPLRQIMRDRLPELVRRRGDKAEFTPALMPVLRRIAEQQFAEMRPMPRAETAAQTVHSVSVDLSAKHVWTLAAVSSFEMWLRQQSSLTGAYRFDVK